MQRRLKKLHPALADVLDPAFAYCRLAETLNQMCADLKFESRDRAAEILHEKFSRARADRLLGLLHRLNTQGMAEVKQSSPRTTLYRDKAALREHGLWPPSATSAELPGLQLPPFEQCMEPCEVAA